MNYDINEKETSLDNMGDSLLEAMRLCIEDSRADDAKSILNEWVVDGRDPMDGEYEFIFIPNNTLIN
tara:strand:+ start:253 stop:453 length:201 start_codon:yes stop_codon:yes gene_type:complete